MITTMPRLDDVLQLVHTPFVCGIVAVRDEALEVHPTPVPTVLQHPGHGSAVTLVEHLAVSLRVPERTWEYRVGDLITGEPLRVGAKGVVKEAAYRRHFHRLSIGESPNHDSQRRDLAPLHYMEERLRPGDGQIVFL